LLLLLSLGQSFPNESFFASGLLLGDVVGASPGPPSQYLRETSSPNAIVLLCVLAKAVKGQFYASDCRSDRRANVQKEEDSPRRFNGKRMGLSVPDYQSGLIEWP
jgi:hypothetical protein